MARLRLAAALVAVALCPALAAAQQPTRTTGSWEIGAGNYTPKIDSDFTPSTTAGLPPGPGPYSQMFGSGRGWLFRVAYSRALFSSFGTLEAGVRLGFFSRSAGGLYLDTTGTTPTWKRSADRTSLKIIPTSLMLTYRFDVLAERYSIPLAPYARFTLERYNWWTTAGNNGFKKYGATNGYSFTGGLALLLDVFDPTLARELDRDTGIHHTYLYFDATRSKVDDFGSKKSWDLSGKEWMLSTGLMFVF
jgi:hypothetical protein